MEVAPPPSFVVATKKEGDMSPFLEKTYDIVNDPNTDEIISWKSTNSFVIWNPIAFACVILPTYFKHNNFSSFTRQLDTYGFRKIHAEHWEYANENFIKDQKHLLKDINRKDSHNHPLDYDELIEKIDNHQTRTNLHLKHFQQRLDAIETMQKKLMNLFEKAIQNPSFVGQLSQKFASG